jgi:hypothetical protein
MLFSELCKDHSPSFCSPRHRFLPRKCRVNAHAGHVWRARMEPLEPRLALTDLTLTSGGLS